MLRRRFGSVSAAHENAIKSLPIRRLESLGEALLDFKRAADLSAWLRRQPPQPSALRPLSVNLTMASQPASFVLSGHYGHPQGGP
jgi:hypothetical protein